MRLQMIRRKMSVSTNHFHRLPGAELLQNIQERARLGMPTGPRVPEIMPPKMADVSPLDRLAPGITPGLVLDRLATKGKYPRSTLNNRSRRDRRQPTHPRHRKTTTASPATKSDPKISLLCRASHAGR